MWGKTGVDDVDAQCVLFLVISMVPMQIGWVVAGCREACTGWWAGGKGPREFWFHVEPPVGSLFPQLEILEAVKLYQLKYGSLHDGH